MRTFLIVIMLVGNFDTSESVVEVRSIEDCLSFKSKVEANKRAEIELVKNSEIKTFGESVTYDPGDSETPVAKIICAGEVK